MSPYDASNIQTSIPGIIARQHTLNKPIHCTGVGVHSGLTVTLRLHPAPANSGIVFRRIDLDPVQEIAAVYDNVVDTKLCTVIGNASGATVGTIEHLMAAFAGCGVDNAIVEIDGPELPIMDGSAAAFVFLIECAGLAAQKAARKAIKILKPITIQTGDKSVSLRPAPVSSFALEIDFAAAVVGKQRRSMVLGSESFKQDLSQARTFGFLHEVDALRRAGLAQGGSLDNAVVINGDRIMNEGGLRYSDEFVRHKLLDAIGDLYLAGCPIIGHFEGARSGHALNNQILHALFAAHGSWVEVDMISADAMAPVDTGWQRQAVAL
jgi:UDP-3-O-[3-hydroxymyristoyl] N-acetylglucosamine deacetylase